MKAAAAVAAVSLALVSVVAVAAPPPAPNVAAAKKALDTARANLTAAMQRAQKDAPVIADLDAAHAAVEALKDALDSGAAFEAQDLDYAKAVLTARKELRADREIVDDRRSKLHIFDQRRIIDQAIAAAADKMKVLDGKEPGQKDFDDARAGVAALKKAVDDARQFAKQDEKFAAYVAQTDATIAKHQKAIDDRWLALSADKQRALLKESRQALASALTAAKEGATDAQFDQANQAAAALAKRLEEGKPLEPKDPAYRADADRARAEQADAKKKLEALLSDTRLAALKSEIEPAYKDLQAAGKAVRSRAATPEQLAEARTATIVVRKLVEKFQPQAALSQPFGQYIDGVKKTLVEVEVELERRALSIATRDLQTALKNLERRAPTDDQFAEAKTAQTVLEKTLETVHVKEPDLSAYVGDARTLLREAPKAIAKRRVELDVQHQREKVEEARKIANTNFTAIYQPGANAERIQAAESSVKLIDTVLEEGAPLTKLDREYASYATEVKKRIKELTEKIASRRIVLAASTGRQTLKEATNAAKTKIDAAKKPEATDADLDGAAKAVDAVIAAIDAGVPLEAQDKGYAAQAEQTRFDLDEKLNDGLGLAKKSRAFRKQTTEALAAGTAAAAAAAGAKDLRAQKDGYDKAVAQFKACAGSVDMFREDDRLAKIVVLVDGSPTTPKDLIATCNQKAQATEQALAEVVGLIGFEDGPKKAYEKGKSLLPGNKTDALAQFYECISSGAILQNRHPELKGRKFQVAGTSMTIAEVIQQCGAQRDSIKPAAGSAPMKK